MDGLSVIVLPQWQGSVRPLARQLVSGAARLAALARVLRIADGSLSLAGTWC